MHHVHVCGSYVHACSDYNVETNMHVDETMYVESTVHNRENHQFVHYQILYSNCTFLCLESWAGQDQTNHKEQQVEEGE